MRLIRPIILQADLPGWLDIKANEERVYDRYEWHLKYSVLHGRYWPVVGPKHQSIHQPGF
ncbi:hypothetical protein ACCI49_22490 [Microbulbifer epialgicus]|uniref:Uncharacterized protein n=1 Tax=Microbulbifer epialgicus TaxID=393907 RepID=A0ABV4P5L1_9GAMM